ncbi:MAG TPA: UbiH/UbiF/VisC/COQ6 family ubiquinone biosynthesis hydroxylase [Acetobacteraceae bacterium]|nr:UbiH/UbiF/VisC/COQ6 family ubiquinone biosynthesis hydroxylase [Acetobacteraceae bacterium]
MGEAHEVAVCVVGAGPVGGTLACLLAAMGVPTAVVDRAPLPPMEHPDFDGRAYAVAAGSRRILQASGLWDALPLATCPIHDIRVSDGRIGRPASPLHLHFDRREVGAEAFGWMVEARSLRMALNAHMARAERLSVFAPAAAEVRFAPDAALIRLGDGRAIRARLVVAAEGRDSPLRRQAGIAVTRWPYRQSGVVCAIAHERPHDNVALEHFLPAGPFAQLPMAASEPGEHVSAIVWTEAIGTARRLMALPDAAFGAEIARRLGGHLGAVRPVGRRWRYPLAALHAHRYAAPRLALVGDAAHAIHPIAGQGLNLGFRDAAALAGLVAEAVGAGDDPGAASLLARYQRARRPDNLAMLATTDALDRLFSTDAPPIRLARDLGIAAVNRIGPLKRAFMRQAMGAG